MIDIKFIREYPDRVKESCKNRGAVCDVDKLISLDEQKRKLLKEVEDLRAQQHKFGKDQIQEAQALKQQIKAREPELERVTKELEELVWQIPNISQDTVPVGENETKNVMVREEGKKKDVKNAKDYLSLAQDLDLIDTERASKVSGSRFGYIKGDLALFEFALVDLAIKTAKIEGFIPIIPPVLIKPEAMKGMGYIDTKQDAEERYFLEKDKLFLVGTSEQSVVPMHMDEVFNEKDLPRRYVAFSTCFREEAGSYGKDTKGILRVHQFDKVEFVSFSHPEKSKEEHEFLLSIEEKLWKLLEIPYRVVQLCTGDLARPSASTMDIEAWLPGQPSINSGQGTYREVSSTSNTTDFQSRRLNIRFRNKEGKSELVHILNGTGFAIGRTLIAILENYQKKDGSIEIPKVLQKYMGKKEIKRPS